MVPIWSHLEDTLKRHEHSLSKADRAMRAVRVELADGTRIVGVRFPEKLLPEVKSRLAAAKEAEKAAEATRVAAGGAAGASQAARSEPPMPVDPRALSKALTKPKTMLDFFAKAPPGAAAAPAAPAAKRPASGAAPASGAKKAKTSTGGPQSFVGPFQVPKKAPAGACPICGSSFAGLSNAQLNAHVDACAGAGSDDVVILD